MGLEGWQSQVLEGLAGFSEEDLFYLCIFELTKIGLFGGSNATRHNMN